MKEVSCRFFETLIRDLRARGIDPRALVEGVPYGLDHLADKDERIPWQAFLRIMENGRAFWTDQDLIAIGERSVDSPLVQFIGVVARLRFSVGGFYDWVARPGGVASQMITSMRYAVRQVGPGRVEIEFRMLPGYAPSRELFLVSQGTYQAMPRMLGVPPARVDLEPLPDGVRLHVRYTEATGLAATLRRVVTSPFNLRQAGEELAAAHETLLARYDELEHARTSVERQRALLDTAYRFGQRIWSARDPAHATSAIALALVEVAGFDGAVVEAAPRGGASVERGQAGAPLADAALRVELAGAGRLSGSVRVGGGTGGQILLDLVAPTIALALDNAFAYRELADHQRNLERKVDERTAELRQARDSLAETVRALEQARDARERIFANISHEIRTPLSLILLAAGDLAAHGALAPAARDGVASIEASARKLLRLVDELLLLAAGEAQALRLRVEPTDVTALVTGLCTTWRPAVESAEVALSLDAAEPATALADPIAVERIVTNLLSNAVKFTPRGGRISVRVERAGEQAAIAVRDTGIGIDDDLLKRLFGRFEQGQGGASVRGGSGIGLSLVKELAGAMGGDVAVERIRTGGTEFRVTLPLTAAPAAELVAPRLRPGDFGLAASPVRSGDVLGPPPGKSAPTVLVAEDDPALAASTARLLAEHFQVVVALDGLAALELATRHQPHLLVTDVEMPGMNGVELTRRFRDLPGNGLAPVVMLSALADLRDRITGLDAGAVDYVVKPFNPRELVARVRAQLEMRNLALRLHRAEKLAALGTLSAGLAHELRNPANGIVNAIAPLRELLPAELSAPGGAVSELLDVLAGCAEQVATLSRQLLGFRRGGDLELRTVPLGDVVHRAVSLLRPALRGIELREHLGAPTPIRCAPPLLVQVITNLVENAAQAAGKGGWVEIASRQHDGHVLVEVADSGPGVPRELRERIFEPFFTTKGPGAGTGLGLPVARDIVHRHGGTLEVRERDDRPVFVIDLPNRAAPEPS